ncbi:hypothetical protein [Bradyrhizobium sp.]|nr:hypothetical protein [Bradyrhizobium sp.]HEV2160053.1 hypothetical protein [Bradyrhizobium sp.]
MSELVVDRLERLEDVVLGDRHSLQDALQLADRLLPRETSGDRFAQAQE